METFEDRMFRAFQMLEASERRRAIAEGRKPPKITNGWISKQMEERFGVKIDQSTVSNWRHHVTVPDTLRKIEAFAQLAGVDPGWLAFGTACAAPGPGDVDRRVTPLARPED